LMVVYFIKDPNHEFILCLRFKQDMVLRFT